MTTHRIVLVGAGEIGSRHLQGLRTVALPIEVVVVDPSMASLERARSRLLDGIDETPFPTRFLTNLSDLPGHADVAVVATSADTRRAAVERLLEVCRVRHLVLEKLLFQREVDYSAVATLMASRGVHAWVNCSRRTWPCFRTLGAALAGSEHLEMLVDGARFGLGSNAIHFLDLFEAFGGGLEEISTNEVDTPFVPSKRPGFIEMTGRLRGRGRHGAITLLSRATGDAPLLVSVVSGRARGSVEQFADGVSGGLEARWRLACADDGWKWREGSETIGAQSAMTGAVITELLEGDACDLPSYEESTRVHLPLVKAMTELYRRITGDAEAMCPIT